MYALLKILAALLARVSPRVLTACVGFLAWISFDVLRIRRGLVMDNLRTAFGATYSEAELRRIGRESIRQFGLTVFEFLRGDCIDFARDVDVVGGEHLRAALARGEGAFILCFHQGNWEAFGAKISRAFTPAHVVVKTVGSASVDRFVSEVRAKNGFHAIKRRGSGDGLRGILAALKRGEIVGFVMDQARPGEPRVPFFGVPAKTNTGLAALWRRRPAPIVPGFCRRLSFDRHVVEFFPALELETTGDLEADIVAHTTIFNAVVADCIRRAPEQYFWLHDRWK